MKKDKKYRFECGGCEKLRVWNKKPQVELRNVAWNTPAYFCSWKCFMEYAKYYLKATGH